MFHIVDDQQGRLLTQGSGQRIQRFPALNTDFERSRNGIQHQIGFGQLSQGNPPHPSLECGTDIFRHGQRQPGFADSASADERDQPLPLPNRLRKMGAHHFPPDDRRAGDWNFEVGLRRRIGNGGETIHRQPSRGLLRVA